MLHTVLGIRNLSATTYALRLERKKLPFKSGQCFNLGVKGSGVNREYSIYSGENDPYLEFLIKEVKSGTVSTSLRHVEIGREVNLHGPYGSFIISPKIIGYEQFNFISTGTGIAPFHSFVRSYPNLEYNIINGVRLLSERYDYDDYNPSKVTTCISRERWGGFNGRVTSYLLDLTVNCKSFFYLCGNQEMIQEAYEILREKNVSGDHIFTEAFF